METATGMAMAVVFVLVLAGIITWLVERYVLVPFDLKYLRTIALVLVIAALVQFVEMFLKKSIPGLYTGLGARAAASANPLYSITQGVPQKAWDVAAMSPKQFAEAARNMQGGLTGEAVRVGSAVNDPQGIDRLREWQAQAQAESRNLMAAGDLDSAMAAPSKSQFFREAVETATRTGSMGHALQTGRVKADIIPATQAEGSLGNVAKEGPPPGKSEVASLMPPSEVIPEHDDDYLVRYSISRPVQDPYVPIRTPGGLRHNCFQDSASDRSAIPPFSHDARLPGTLQRKLSTIDFSCSLPPLRYNEPAGRDFGLLQSMDDGS